MMKFLRAAILPLVALSLLAGPALAGVQMATFNVPFRKYCTQPAGDLSWKVVSGTAGFVDSLTVSVNSTGGPAAAADTTAPFVLAGLSGLTQVGVGADSLSLCTVALSPDYWRNTTVAADSFTVKLQGSWNGRDWVSGVAVDLVENTTSNTFERVFDFARNSAATPTNIQLGFFPYYRVIWTDWTGTTGDYQCSISYFKDVVSK